MLKALDAARKIKSDLTIDHTSLLEEINLHDVFSSLKRHDFSTEEQNKIICFIIYAYDPDSSKIDIRKDRYDDTKKIAASLGCDIQSPLFKSILDGNQKTVTDVALCYLEALTDWRWAQIYAFLDFHSKMMRFANQATEEYKVTEEINEQGNKQSLKEDYDITKIVNVNKQKGELLMKGMEAREKAEELLEQIRKAYVNTDVATQGDFGFSFTDSAKKKIDPESWREYIRERNKRLAG